MLVQNSFEFEDHVKAHLPTLADSASSSAVQTINVLGLTHRRVDPRHRSVVCTHWLSGLCQKGTDCDFLHKLDKSKCAACNHGKTCKIKNCPLMHIDDGARPECVLFKQGFCFHGSRCKYRHVKLAPDACPAIGNFVMTAESMANTAVPLSKKRKTQEPNAFYKISLCKHWLTSGVCPFGEECHYSHGEEDLKKFQGTDDLDDSDVYDPVRSKMDNSNLVVPWSEDANVVYFMVHSPDIRSLVVSRRRGVWALPVAVAAEIASLLYKNMNEVILFFFVKALGGVYGIAKVKGPMLPNNPMYPMSPEFPVEWLRTTRISLKMVSQLKMVDGQSVARTSYDGSLSSTVGYEILLILFRKEMWDWSVDVTEAESKKFDEERYTQAPLGVNVLFPPAWIERSVDMFALDRANQIVNVEDEFYYKGAQVGFVCGVTRETFDECMAKKLFGLPTEMKEVSSAIEIGSPLFLMDPSSDLLFGLFEAVTTATELLDPTAFVPPGHTESFLPIQVRFNVVLDSPSVSLREPDVNSIFSPRFGPLQLDETRKLANIFAIRAGAWDPRSRCGTVSGGGGGNPVPELKPHQRGWKPQFEHVANVPVTLIGDNPSHHFIGQIRRLLLGTNGQKIQSLLNTLAPSGQARARLRGRGSGFF